jgi:hypothetical protein
MSEFNWKGLLDHLIIVEGECMEENYGEGRATNEMDEECNAGIRKAYAQLVAVQPVLLAAPELLEALRSAVAVLSGWECTSKLDAGDTQTVRLCKAALAKAEGLGG